MKKFLPFLAFGMLLSAVPVVCAEEEPAKSAQVEITEEESAAYNRFIDKLREEYLELDVQDRIVDAFQKTANENREDFEVVLRLRGVDLENAEGEIVQSFIVPLYIAVQ